MTDTAGHTDLGPCCACEKPNDATVRNLIHFDFEAPADFHGWGCVVCGIAFRGAIAVLCDACLVAEAQARFIMAGTHPAQGKRQALENFPRVPFSHIHERHPELDPRAWQGSGPFPPEDERPNCYSCKHRRPLPNDMHSQCRHPAFAALYSSYDRRTPMERRFMLLNPGAFVAKGCRVVGHPYGIANGGFAHPVNFDPVWLLTCTGFESLPTKDTTAKGKR